MKCDQWTVALAALGVVSFASAAKAEEAVNSVLTAVSSTTLSGYVDTSAQWNFGTGNANLPPYKFGGASKADGFNFNVVQLRLEKPLDEAQWAAGYRVDLWAGPDANTLNTASVLSSATSDFAIRQAYVLLRTPVGNGIDLKVGVFDSILGYESIESPNNPNYTRSWGHSIEPQTHTGVLASYRFSELISASVGVANTFNSAINDRAFSPVETDNPKAESYKTYMGSLAITAPEGTGFLAGSTLYAGIVNGFDGGSQAENVTSYYAGATVATPVTGLRFGAAFDLLNVHHESGETWAVAGYASWQATEKLSFHGRADYLKDRGDQKLFVADDDLGFQYATNPDETLTLTGTIQYDIWQNVVTRLEVRWDHALSGGGVYGGTQQNSSGSSDGDLKNVVMLAANIVYRF